MRVLILGYGNVDRQDDGVAWHVIQSLLHRLGYAKVEEFEENEPQEFGNVDFLFQLQLVPEFSELIANYDRVCFIDAHTGSVPDNVHLEDLIPGYQHSPFTHHLTASSLLAMSSSIYHKNAALHTGFCKGIRIWFFATTFRIDSLSGTRCSRPHTKMVAHHQY